jgi:ATP-dependent helicase HrpA
MTTDNAEHNTAQELKISFPAKLPVSERRDAIAEAIATNQVVIVAGETGSGKTTQLPKICLQLGRGQRGQIGHTQPRRLAARTVAGRIAEELGTALGDTVGYQVRFTDQVSEQTRVKLMTDGILLAEMQRDRLLKRYDTLIIDEAHERSLNIDFLLGYLKQLLPKRPDLKLIITSATIDVESFSRHFDNAPVIEVSGRTYPVQTVYQPVEESERGELNPQIVGLVEAIDAGDYGARGDVLVFLPGERDIRELAKLLRRHTSLDVLPLYARLSQSEQNRVFDVRRRKGLRVVLATNVAETSLTVPGIRYVIDPGLARISRYSYRTKVQRLPIEAISQASANQRQGRCGRVAEGVCIRLYSEQDFLSREEFTAPEIQRTNLAAVILQMLVLKLGAVEKFPFINPPDNRLVRDGYKLLQELAAVDGEGRVTPLGRRMARLPVDPRLAAMVLSAADSGCLPEVLVIASALAVQDPRERPAEKQQQSDQAHARFKHPKSDFFAYLALWRYYEEQRQELSQNQLRKLCQREFLSFMRLREWRDIHHQLSVACRQLGLRAKGALPEESDFAAVHTALLAGLLGNIAQWQEGRDFTGARGRQLQIFPGSSLARKPPKWIVAAEVVETSKVYARTVAAIDPAWVVAVNPDLIKHHYYEPRWQTRTGRVMAYERLSLYGLTLLDKRSVHYGPLEPVVARELLIREGLIAGRYRQPPAFLRHNQAQVKALEELESRTRRRDIVADEQVQFAFYDERLPDSAYTASRLQSWLKRQRERDASLRFPDDLLMARDPGEQLAAQFPDALEWDDLVLPLSYQFEPGKHSDGVSVTIPVGLLNRVPRFLFDWLVPGMLREKCIALIKGLPKGQRKQLVPVPDVVDAALAQLSANNESLTAQLSAVLRRQQGVVIESADWSAQSLDDYYRMNIRVVDADGKLLQQGRDLQALVARYRDHCAQAGGDKSDDDLSRSGIQRWDFDVLPEESRAVQAGVEIVSYPALVTSGEQVAIELFDYPEQAAWAHRAGVIRLCRLASRDQEKYLRKQLLRGNAFSLMLAGAGLERAPLVDDMVNAAYAQALELPLLGGPRTRTEFEAVLAHGRNQVVSRANELEAILHNTLEKLSAVRAWLAGGKAGGQGDTARDIEQQLAGLFAPGFMAETPVVWLQQYPRYLKALAHRCERYSGQFEKDQRHTAELVALMEPLDAAATQRDLLLQRCAGAQQYRWLLEEYRVSLFAQQLGTKQAVSGKRLRVLWREVEDWLQRNPQ